ncbi:hypothetical protein ACFQY5_18945 [Paeniroseomonas aquatica]|uniref:Uncharacterized protein n=1 Tax=Paeniroseomonas aquatica TaxID=373043 RepID=A0ABT8AE69_9PROT|nr:hypothetical protein [Paeniroseomonas aquatica]MDN3568008.1 hypothetical protein [Paeniroseomonas aquatica]
MEAFNHFLADINRQLVSASTDKERVDVAGDTLKTYITRPDFVHSCIERCLMTMQNGRSRWRNPQIAEDIDAGYLMRMLFWPARFKGDIHRHNRWTVTGVVSNAIDAILYDDAGEKEVKRFSGIAGDIGKVVPPCVHAAENVGDVPAVTLAVFCRTPKSQQFGDEVEWITETQEGKYAAGIFDRALRAFIFMINHSPTERSLHLLDTIYILARPSMKLLAIKAMARIDPIRGLRRLEDAYHYLDGPDDKAQVARAAQLLREAIRA